MRIKRYRARDTQTALRMIKDELGSEAVILSTREVSGELGSAVEITAGVNYQPQEKNRIPAPYRNQAEKPPPEPPVTAPPQAPPLSTRDNDWGPAFSGLEGGLAEIKDLLLDLTHRTSLPERVRDRGDLVRLYRELIEAELDPAVARALVDRLADKNGGAAALRRDLRQSLSQLLKTRKPGLALDAPGPHYLALVGPSGVGKTTTLAKLAAFWAVREKKNAALISLDTFRLGAEEQLRTYARIMGLPVRVVQDEEEFVQAVELFENMDLVLIDTASRALSRAEDLDELGRILGRAPGVGILLVLSAVTKDRDIAQAIVRTERLGVDSLIITKIDETQRYGNVINNLLKSKKPVSFLTNGQKVPDDIIPATPGRLAELIAAGW